MGSNGTGRIHSHSLSTLTDNGLASCMFLIQKASATLAVERKLAKMAEEAGATQIQEDKVRAALELTKHRSLHGGTETPHSQNYVVVSFVVHDGLLLDYVACLRLASYPIGHVSLSARHDWTCTASSFSLAFSHFTPIDPHPLTSVSRTMMCKAWMCSIAFIIRLAFSPFTLTFIH